MAKWGIKGYSCPPPDNFDSGPPEKSNLTPENDNHCYHKFPVKGHNKPDETEFYESLWGVFDGQRHR